jgi:hypothetical protein
MKRLVIAAALFLAGVVLYTVAPHAQKADCVKRIRECDPHYKVEPRMRGAVCASLMDPEKSVMH